MHTHQPVGVTEEASTSPHCCRAFSQAWPAVSAQVVIDSVCTGAMHVQLHCIRSGRVLGSPLLQSSLLLPYIARTPEACTCHQQVPWLSHLWLGSPHHAAVWDEVWHRFVWFWEKWIQSLHCVCCSYHICFCHLLFTGIIIKARQFLWGKRDLFNVI